MRESILGLLILAGCSGAGPGATEATIAGAGSAAPPPVVAGARALPLDATLPKDAALVVTLEMSAARRILANVFGVSPGEPEGREDAASTAREAEKALGVGKGSLSGDGALETLGFDGSRRASLAIAPVPPAAKGRLGALEVLADKAAKKGVGFASEVEGAFGGAAVLTRFRVLLPVSDAAAAKRAVRHLFASDGFTEHGGPEGVDLMLHKRAFTIATSADDVWMVVDVVRDRRAPNKPAPEVIAAIAALRREGERGASGLDPAGAALKGRIDPRALAEIGFLEGIGATLGALKEVDGKQKDEIAAEGFVEAHRNLEIAGDARGAYFKSVDFTADPAPKPGEPMLRASATFGPAYEAAAKAARAVPRGLGIDGSSAVSCLDVSTAAGLAFPLPGDKPGTPLQEPRADRMFREAGWTGWFVGSPLVATMLMSLPIRQNIEAFTDKSAPQKFERVALIEQARGGGELWIGVLRAGTGEAEAGCALAGKSPCANKLRLGAPATKTGDKHARLTKVNDRFVLVLGSNAAGADGYQPLLGPAAAPPMRAKIPGHEFRGSEARALFGPSPPNSFRGTVEVGESALTLRVDGGT